MQLGSLVYVQKFLATHRSLYMYPQIWRTVIYYSHKGDVISRFFISILTQVLKESQTPRLLCSFICSVWKKLLLCLVVMRRPIALFPGSTQLFVRETWVRSRRLVRPHGHSGYVYTGSSIWICHVDVSSTSRYFHVISEKVTKYTRLIDTYTCSQDQELEAFG